MMKKTLVALAAVAVTGGAFAQATMTGALAYGYSQKTTSAGATSGGMGLDTSDLYFGISEEVEGLGKVSGGLGISTGGKGVATAGTGNFIQLDMGSMGTIKMDNVYANSWLGGVASPGSVAYCTFSSGDCTSGVGMFSTYGYQDDLIYSLKLSDSLSVSVSHTEPSTAAGGGGAAGTQYIYSGGTGSGQRYNTYSGTFKSGALTIAGGYRTYDGADQSTKNSNFRHRAAASYDMGVAKIGAGYETTQNTYGSTTTDTVVGLSAPLGALTVSAQYGQRAVAGSTADSSYAGAIYAASYALSKRTSWDATYLSNQSSGTSSPSFFITRLVHSF
jgi:hypothetical protein